MTIVNFALPNKFSDTIPDALTDGFATQDDYTWICKKCFEDFKLKFEFTLLASKEP